MADVAELGVAGYWSLDASDEDQQVVYVPGLSKKGNIRPAPKPRSMKTGGAKSKMPVPTADNYLSQHWHNQQERQVASEEAEIKSASLKDLCPEDKRRIANLIKELARVSEEKEVTEERLKTEQESFEKKIRQLEEQNNLIITEREALQHQYRECQELLSLYQKYLSEQQEKLNQSLSELRGSQQPQVSDQVPQGTVSSDLNGSYLCQPYAPLHHKSRSEAGSSCSHGTNRHCRSEPSSRLGLCYNQGECCLGSGLQGKGIHAGFSDLHCSQQPKCLQSHHCGSIFNHQETHCCLHNASKKTQNTPDLSPGGRSVPYSFVRNSSTSLPGNGVTQPKEPAYGQSLSEDKKHQLILQKMELEIEKERLQQMLAQQEAKLCLKEQQLQQTRLDYNRTHPDPVSQLPLASDISGPPLRSVVPMTNGSGHSPVKPTSEDTSTPPARKSGKNQNKSVGSSPEKKISLCRTPKDVLLVHSQNGFSKDCRKYSSTPPTAASVQPELMTDAVSPVQRSLCRYETSLIDMLDAISPISVQRQPLEHREVFDLSPPPRTSRKFFRRPISPGVPPTEDPEESRMLEEIFFIY
ncbi:protein hinderin [Bombina bombina]|uniref:protein hinderin n=1 Tax=Bombina bombina TaxID=8345 RepID=UPI00235AD213|nr:protein hinderin [Bombina bombina]